jgi:hypothetical protein
MSAGLDALHLYKAYGMNWSEAELIEGNYLG